MKALIYKGASNFYDLALNFVKRRDIGGTSLRNRLQIQHIKHNMGLDPKCVIPLPLTIYYRINIRRTSCQKDLNTK